MRKLRIFDLSGNFVNKSNGIVDVCVNHLRDGTVKSLNGDSVSAERNEIAYNGM